MYGKGNVILARDYETSLKWYAKARDQGIEISAPMTYPASQPGAKRVLN